MRGSEEEEKKICVKLTGVNQRSYLDVAKKQPSSTIMGEQEDLEMDLNNSKLASMQKLQIHNRSFQKQTQSDYSMQKQTNYMMDSFQMQQEQRKELSQMFQGFEQDKLKKSKFQETVLATSTDSNQYNNRSEGISKIHHKKQSKSPLKYVKEKTKDKAQDQIKNASLQNSKGLAFKTKVSIMNQQTKNIDCLEASTKLEQIDQIKECLAQQEISINMETEEKIKNLNNSQKNFLEQAPSSKLLHTITFPTTQISKSQSLMGNQSVIKKQNWQHHQTCIEKIREFESYNSLCQQQSKKSDICYDFISKDNSFMPQNTSEKKRYSLGRNQNQSQKNLSESYKQCWNGSSYYWAFDKISIFLYFFPQYNYKNIIYKATVSKERAKIQTKKINQ